MKNIIKKNKYLLISLGILLLWGGYVVFQTSQKNLDYLKVTDPIMYFYHMFSDLSLYDIQIIGPLFVIVPSIMLVHKELNSGYIKNVLTRIEYKKYMKKKYFETLKCSLILPVFVIIMFLCSCVLAKGFAIGSNAEYYGRFAAAPDPKYLTNLPLFMFTYVFVIFLHSILYMNLGLLFCKKNSNSLVSIVLGYLSFIVIDIFMEILLGDIILSMLLNIRNLTDSFNLFNIWKYDNVKSLGLVIGYSLTLVVCTTLLLIKKYKNKESVVIEIEKHL